MGAARRPGGGGRVPAGGRHVRARRRPARARGRRAPPRRRRPGRAPLERGDVRLRRRAVAPEALPRRLRAARHGDPPAGLLRRAGARRHALPGRTRCRAGRTTPAAATASRPPTTAASRSGSTGSDPRFDPTAGERLPDADDLRLARAFLARRFPDLAAAPAPRERASASTRSTTGQPLRRRPAPGLGERLDRGRRVRPRLQARAADRRARGRPARRPRRGRRGRPAATAASGSGRAGRGVAPTSRRTRWRRPGRCSERVRAEPRPGRARGLGQGGALPSGATGRRRAPALAAIRRGCGRRTRLTRSCPDPRGHLELGDDPGRGGHAPDRDPEPALGVDRRRARRSAARRA